MSIAHPLRCRHASRHPRPLAYDDRRGRPGCMGAAAGGSPDRRPGRRQGDDARPLAQRPVDAVDSRRAGRSEACYWNRGGACSRSATATSTPAPDADAAYDEGIGTVAAPTWRDGARRRHQTRGSVNVLVPHRRASARPHYHQYFWDHTERRQPYAPPQKPRRPRRGCCGRSKWPATTVATQVRVLHQERRAARDSLRGHDYLCAIWSSTRRRHHRKRRAFLVQQAVDRARASRAGWPSPHRASLPRRRAAGG